MSQGDKNAWFDSTQNLSNAGSSVSGSLNVNSSSTTITTTLPYSPGGTSGTHTPSTGQPIWVTPNTSPSIPTVPTITTPYVGGGSASSPYLTVTDFAPMITFNTPYGNIEIHRDGRIVLPAGLSVDEGMKLMWEKLEEVARQSFEAAVRKEAAKAVREHLPRLLPDLDEYQKAFLPSQIANAIETSKN